MGKSDIKILYCITFGKVTLNFIHIITESLPLEIKMEEISNDQLIKTYEASELPKSNHLFNFISASQWTEQFSDLRIVVSSKALI